MKLTADPAKLMKENVDLQVSSIKNYGLESDIPKSTMRYIRLCLEAAWTNGNLYGYREAVRDGR